MRPTAIFFCLSTISIAANPANPFLCIVKVLIIHQHFRDPRRGGAIRSYYLAKALVENGIETVVITAHNEPGYRKECLEGVAVHYLAVPYDNRFGFIKRVLSFLKFAYQSFRLAGACRDATLCYAISTPLTTGLAAMFIRRRFKIPYIFEVGDLWPDAPIEMGFIRNPLVKRLLFRLEKAVYEKSVSVVALSPAIRDSIRQKAPEKIIHLLPNMADTDFFQPAQKDPELDRKYGVEGMFVVAYTGAVGVANGLFYFLDCAAASQRQGLNVHFLLCGDGAMLQELIGYSKQLKLHNLTFIPFQTRVGVREVMQVADANFICYKRVKILETGSPNKYFDGLAAGKLTVINFGGWIRNEVEGEACGVYADPNDPENFVRKIKPFIDDKQLLKNYQSNGRRLAETRYSRSILCERYRSIVKGATTH